MAVQTTTPAGAFAFVTAGFRAIRSKLLAERTHGELVRFPSAQLRDIGLGDNDLEAFSRNIARQRA